MGWISEALETRAGTSGIQNPANWLWDAVGGVATATGKRVDADSALKYSAVWAAVRLVSESAASLPLVTYERLIPRGKRRAFSHPIFPILHDNVNERQTSFEWVETTVAHLMLRGNAYSWVERDNGARITGLWILDPRHMTVRALPNGDIWYSWEPPDVTPLRALAGSGDILHIRGFDHRDGLLGASAIGMARESIALGLAAEEYGARFFSNSATPSGVLEHPQQLNEDSIKRLKSSLAEHRSMSNSHKTLILEEGMKWNSVGVSPEDAQMIESRRFQISDVARWFRVPPHMIGDLEKATFSNIEAQGIDFVVHTMRPWLVRIEKAMQRDLLLPTERPGLFIEFLVDALLRGDSETRAKSYALGRQWGWFSVNDILEMENRNPIDEGDVYLTPLNMVSAGTEPPVPPPGEADRQAVLDAEFRDRTIRETRAARSVNMRREIGKALQPIFRDAARAIVRAEKRELLKPIKNLAEDENGFGKLRTIVDRFYESKGELSEFARKQIDPAICALRDSVLPLLLEEVGTEASISVDLLCDSLSQSFGERYAGTSRHRINELMDRSEGDAAILQESLEAQLVNWDEVRSETVAKVETSKAKSAIARNVFVAAGVLVIRWVAFGENCPICDSLDGKTVGIEQNFASQGTDVGPEGQSIKPRTDITHPPIHDGCDCDISIG